MLGLRESLGRAVGDKELVVDISPNIMFNPTTRSANFFIPGLVVVMCQMMAIMLSANSIVREKELGTLEQLFMTPVRAGELILGKLLPYLVLTFVEFCGIAVLAQWVFGVPMNGPFWVLLAIAVPFVLSMLAWGLLISTKVDTRDAAMQTRVAAAAYDIAATRYNEQGRRRELVGTLSGLLEKCAERAVCRSYGSSSARCENHKECP